jgi:hypothetical protein
MKLRSTRPKTGEAGMALPMVMILSALALALLASVMVWSSTSSQQTHRAIQYTRSVAAAEGATEKVISRMEQDFMNGGERMVSNNLTQYRSTLTPSPSDSSYWSTWTFDDGNGNLGQVYIQQTSANTYNVLGSTFANLHGYSSTYNIVSHASDNASPQRVNAGVLQSIKLTGIPIFQFSMFSSDDMEVSCGQPFNISGRVHANGNLYVEPDSSLTFESSVTSALQNLFKRDPLDTRGPPAGSVVYTLANQPVTGVNPLTLPIGVSNSPTAIREIIEPPPPGEDPGSPLGQLRYYNEADMIIVDSSNGISVTSGSAGGFAPVQTNQPSFVSDANSFYDAREGKTVQPVDIDVGALTTWSETNTHIHGLATVYVMDTRNLPATSLAAVRLYDGMTLPPNGLTVATGRPLYVQGDYNELNPTNLGTANTSTTEPASLVADAITILSDNWQDGNSTAAVGSRLATGTTVNAALLTGVVETTLGHYSGGMENFPRFLETWGSAATFTYNGSMVKMFPSLYATNVWGQANVYDPPRRNWAYDLNFEDPTKLPPKTPSLLQSARSQWLTVPPGQNVASATY